jgi:hypothetical protein
MDHSKHVSRDCYAASLLECWLDVITVHYCDISAHAPIAQTKRKHTFPTCCVHIFWVWTRDDVLLLLHVGTCLQSWVFMLQYLLLYCLSEITEV